MTRFKPGDLCHVSIQQGGGGFMYELPMAVIKNGQPYYKVDAAGYVEYLPVDSTEFDVMILMPFDGKGKFVRYVVLYQESLILVHDEDLKKVGES